MDRVEAMGILGIGEGTADNIVDLVQQTKLKEIEDRIESAPTDALKEKYKAQIEQLNEAVAVFKSGAGSDVTQTSVSPDAPTGFPSQGGVGSSMSGSFGNSGSPLSATKMADLPQVDQSFTMADGAAPGEALQMNPGTVLADRYEVKERVGAGGMGAVFRAYDRTRQKDIAIKLMHPALLSNDKARERFLDEARISSEMSHPGIVNVYDVTNYEGFSFLTMELLEGSSLREFLQAHPRGLDVDEAVRIGTAVGEALAYAHQYTVHRDVKPENIFMTEDGQLKLMDFGIARVQSTTQRTKTGAAMGTAYYMAPEQLKAAAHVDGRADMYSLAVMMYEMVTGELPQGRFDDPHVVNKAVSKNLSAAIVKGMEVSPEARFRDMGEFVKALSGTVSVKARKQAKVHVGGGGMSGVQKIAAAVLILAAGGAVAMDVGGIRTTVTESLFPDPMIEANAISLQGELKVLQKKVEEAKRKLEQETRDAEQELRSIDSSLRVARDAADKNALEKQKQEFQVAVDLATSAEDISNSVIFTTALESEMSGLVSLAENQIRAKGFKDALANLTKVKEVLNRQLSQAESVQNMVSVRYTTMNIRRDWLAIVTEMGQLESEENKAISAQFDEAEAQMTAGEFANAVISYGKTHDPMMVEGNWAYTMKSNTVNAYREFRENFPDSGHVDQAVVFEDDAEYYIAKNKDTLSSYDRYMELWPEGRHVDEAKTARKARYDYLDEQAWKKAKSTNTPASYNQYYTRFPDGKYAGQVATQVEKYEWDRIRNSKRMSDFSNYVANFTNERRKQTPLYAKQADDSAFKIATANRTYPEYMRRFPNGAHFQSAYDAQESLDWQVAIGSYEPPALQKFITSYPESNRRAEAEEKLLESNTRLAMSRELKRLGYKVDVKGKESQPFSEAISDFMIRMSMTGDMTNDQIIGILKHTRSKVWKDGDYIRDCQECPVLRVIELAPPQFPSAEAMAKGDFSALKMPRHIAIARTETSFTSWQACYRDRERVSCQLNPKQAIESGFGASLGQFGLDTLGAVLAVGTLGVIDNDLGTVDDDERVASSVPVFNVKPADIKHYLAWLKKKAGGRVEYRLPTLAEYRMITWQSDAQKAQALKDYKNLPGTYDRDTPTAVNSGPVNHMGFYQLLGNVREWTSDCETAKCEKQYVFGSSFQNDKRKLNKDGDATPKKVKNSSEDVGFRVARTIVY